MSETETHCGIVVCVFVLWIECPYRKEKRKEQQNLINSSHWEPAESGKKCLKCLYHFMGVLRVFGSQVVEAPDLSGSPTLLSRAAKAAAISGLRAQILEQAI